MAAKQNPITVLDILARKGSAERLVMVTAYDATFAALFDPMVDAVLVGDSLGMVVQGHKTTLPVTLEQMVYHTAAVSRGLSRAHLVADLPFMSYQVSAEEALVAAGKLVKEGGAHAVKLEGGACVVPQIQKIVGAGIPVMGHIGLTPQSVHQMGGFRVQGLKPDAARLLVEDARKLAAAGCYALVLESIPRDLAYDITTAVQIPTIGIGAGPNCDGQVLVSYDLLGLNPQFKPKFLKQYANLHDIIQAAVAAFADDVKAGIFPSEAHSFGVGPKPLQPAEPQPCTPLYSCGD